MPFTLFYRGPLRASGNKDDKHCIRLALHPQLESLWHEEPLTRYQQYLTKAADSARTDVLYDVEDFHFACLVTERLKVYAELDILFLRPQPPGQIISSGGDLDNRLKTLFDALRCPTNASELPTPSLRERTPNPCHCLLSDDSLISRVSVATDRLLDANAEDEVVLIIKVCVRKSVCTYGNIAYIE